TMKFEWHIEPIDIQAFKDIVTQQQYDPFVIDRVKRNVDGILPEINHNEMWKMHVMCLLTSQQRSGPDRPVSNLLSEEVFRLSLENCNGAKDTKSFITSTLTDFGGIRFAENIAKRATA